jgi:hypothetical protein
MNGKWVFHVLACDSSALFLTAARPGLELCILLKSKVRVVSEKEKWVCCTLTALSQ